MTRALVLWVALLGGCGDDSGEDEDWACRYHRVYSSICYGETDFDESDECVDVYEPGRCDVITEDFNDCTGQCCSETSYSNVSVGRGTCAEGGGGGDWTCSPSYYGAGDGCDCGCGTTDPDCTSGGDCTTPDCCSAGSCGGCDYCWPTSGACT